MCVSVGDVCVCSHSDGVFSVVDVCVLVSVMFVCVQSL